MDAASLAESVRADLTKLRAEVEALGHTPIAQRSRTALTHISLDLRSVAQRISAIAQEPGSVSKQEVASIQDDFKGLVETVQHQLHELQEFRRSSNTDVDDLGGEQRLKKPKPLKGTLKKLGEKGLIKTWKTRFFLQAGVRLNYFETEGSVTPRSFIPLNDVTKVVRKEKLIFELHVPGRVYVLQAFDELELEEWVIRTNEWMEYFKAAALQNSQASAMTPYKSEFARETEEEEKLKIMQVTVANQEIQNDILQEQMAEAARQIAEDKKNQENFRANLEETFTFEINSARAAIEAEMLELKQNAEHLEKEEKRGDHIRQTIAQLEAELVLLQSEMEERALTVQRLKGQFSAQSESVVSLEENLEELRQKPKPKSPAKLSRKAATLSKQTHETRKASHQQQVANANLYLDVASLERRRQAVEESHRVHDQRLRERVATYQMEMKDLHEILIEGHGDEMGLIKERDLLKEHYFNALVIQLKLQYGYVAKNIDLDVRDLYERLEFLAIAKWPQLIMDAVLGKDVRLDGSQLDD